MRLLSCLLSGHSRKHCEEPPWPVGQSTKFQQDSVSHKLAPMCLGSKRISGSAVLGPADVPGPGIDGVPSMGSEAFIRLVHLLSTVEGCWWSALSKGCQAICDCLNAAHACIFVLSTGDFWATTAACAGLGASAAVGRAYSSDPRFNGSAPAAMLRTRKEFPSQALIYRTASGSSPSGTPPASGAAPGAGAASFQDSGDVPPSFERRTSDDLPGDWQLLHEEYGLDQFAAVLWTTEGGEPVGLLCLAAKGPVRPVAWTPQALHSAVGLMGPQIRRAQTVLASSALSQLHAAATFSDLVNAVAEAAVDVAAAVAYVRGQSRVAFIGENMAAAAIFQQRQQQPPEGDPLASVPLLKVRRSSCDFVMMPTGLRKSATTTTLGRISMDGLTTVPTEGERGPTTTDGLKRESWNQRHGSTTNVQVHASNYNASFTLSFPKGTPCKGHTLMLHRTLLDEALSKQVAGLCIDDCQAYTVSMKAYPRDLVLSRGAVMPLSLALATTSDESRPRMALYITYGISLPRALLQAVVQELQQLLQAVLPIIAAKLSGAVRPEYEYLVSQLQEATQRRGKPLAPHTSACATMPSADTLDEPSDCGGLEEQRASSFILPGDAAPPALPSLTPSLRAGCGGSDQPSPTCGPPTPTTLAQAQLSLPRLCAIQAPVVRTVSTTATAAPPLFSLAQLTGGGSARPTAPSNATAAEVDSIAGGGTLVAREPLEGDIDLDYPARRGPRAQALSMPTGTSTRAASESASVHAHRLLSGLATRSVSFHLEAAQVPRGASKLAPIIASMHDRLKAAQAVQMAISGRSEACQQDIQSIKLLQEIGQGGYGTVYRGTFHGTEVAVKIIKQSRLAGVRSSSNLLASSHGLGLHKQNLHDAIELVASVSMSHINIVQVPAYFMDVRLERPDDASLESADVPTESRPFRLRHSPSLMESPKAGQDLYGEGAMALVLEYCDCGSLCDAILNRKFIERVTPKKPPAAGNGSGGASGSAATPPKTYLAVNMRSVYATLLEIALALRHMHSLALVHCDLKPQNVLLKSSPRDPRGFTAKLSDFGLAKMMAHDDEGQLVIDEAVASGTITHVAPEVLLGQKALGAAVDIYAFGILMYQLLCGVKVYDKMKSASVIANAVAHRFMRPQLPPWVPSSYRSLAESCWAHEASARPTAHELVRHLEQTIESKRAGGSSSSRVQPLQQQQQQQHQHQQQHAPRQQQK